MTDFHSYQEYPSSAPDSRFPKPLFVAAADPAPQQRVTVLFRLLLALPHLVVLALLGVAATIVMFLGWWGALFTARLPRFAVTFLSGYLHYWTRTWGYVLLLTDVNPRFILGEDPGYPVRVAIPEPQRLNRAAVFFRFFLLYPANILVTILSYGIVVALLPAWLLTLVNGRTPDSLHQALAAVLRFQARYYCYQAMLTPAYPGSLYGDKPGAAAWAGVPVPGYGAPGGYGTRPPFQSATWLLSLIPAARTLLTTIVVLGSLLLIAKTVDNVEHGQPLPSAIPISSIGSSSFFFSFFF